MRPGERSELLRSFDLSAWSSLSESGKLHLLRIAVLDLLAKSRDEVVDELEPVRQLELGDYAGVLPPSGT